VQTDPHRQEIKNMRKSSADVLQEEGRLKSRRETLLQLLRAKYGEPPAGVIASVEVCADIPQLDAWTKAILTAWRLSDIGIPARG
jgi:hypothetical protein